MPKKFFLAKSVLPIGLILLLSGCSLVPGFVHIVAINIGASKQEVISSVHHVLGDPGANYYMFENTDNEIELLVYNRFFPDTDIYFCFYDNKLFQALLPGSSEELEFRPDFKNPEIGSGFPRSYLISIKGNVRKLTTVEK